MTDLRNNQDATRTGSLKSYAAPKLEIFGEVAALTASGSLTSGENKGSMAANMA
tara:strand:+ start:412 stop:573 length:162 start_codon:yes stop_codon:yes gene_type:complete